MMSHVQAPVSKDINLPIDSDQAFLSPCKCVHSVMLLLPYFTVKIKC